MLKQQKIGMLLFHAIARVEAHRLEPEDLNWLCDELEKIGYGNPFFREMEAYVPVDDRREFLRWVCLSPNYNAITNPTDYLEAAEEWRHKHDYPLPATSGPYSNDIQ